MTFGIRCLFWRKVVDGGISRRPVGNSQIARSPLATMYEAKLNIEDARDLHSVYSPRRHWMQEARKLMVAVENVQPGG
jgi:hypothetical protein